MTGTSDGDERAARQCCRLSAAPVRWSTDLMVYWSAGQLVRWSAGLICLSVHPGLSVRRSASLPVRWSAGLPVHGRSARSAGRSLGGREGAGSWPARSRDSGAPAAVARRPARRHVTSRHHSASQRHPRLTPAAAALLPRSVQTALHLNKPG